MHHLAAKAVAAALVVGAGTGAVTKIDTATTNIPRDVLNPMVAGQAMLTGQTIYDNAVKSPEHDRFVAAADAAGLAETLKGSGQYTVFAPTDAAYAALPREAGADAERNARYLVVRGKFDSQTLLGLINANGGEARLFVERLHAINTGCRSLGQ